MGYVKVRKAPYNTLPFIVLTSIFIATLIWRGYRHCSDSVFDRHIVLTVIFIFTHSLF